MGLEDATDENYYAWVILAVVWTLVALLWLSMELDEPAEQLLFGVNVRAIMIVLLLGGAGYLFVMAYKYRTYHRQSSE